MKTILQKTVSLSLLLAAAALCLILPVARAEASFEIPGICQVQTDTGITGTVKTLDYSYDDNTYLSLRDTAMLLGDTDQAFSLEITGTAVSLRLDSVYTPVGGENVPWEGSGYRDIALRRNEFKVNGEKVFYYTMIMQLPSGEYDCFMTAVDLAMILDVSVTALSADSLQIDTREPFDFSPAALEEAGYFCGLNSVLVGDATTGEIYYQYQSDTSYPIASTSKLMTCLLTMEAISSGQLTLDQQVTVSATAQSLATSSDGVVPLRAGEQITIQELLVGALLPSSNECALSLAEAVAGTEEAFVRMMNEKAQELGLSGAIFFNSNGLPSYTEDFIPAKRQNRMSAKDMFRLASYLLHVYPQITDITSLEEATLESLDFEVRNTNPLLRNLPGVTGLKTGTTNRAGACLVTSLTADDGTREHDLVVIVLGAEDSIERGRVSGMLARYAQNTFKRGIQETGSGADVQTSGNLPTHAEAVVDWVVQTARKHQLSQAEAAEKHTVFQI